MRAAVVVCLALFAVSASAYREYAHAANAGALHAGAQGGPQGGPLPENNRKVLEDIVVRKATCPFVGSAVYMQELAVTQQTPDKNRPTAAVQGVVDIANTGPSSTLGWVLRVFASGNHAKMLGKDKLDAAVPAGQFALDFPGSQGAHAGHSGILMGAPHTINSGRWDQAAWARLLAKADKSGAISTKAFGQFIAENIHADPKSKTATDAGLLKVIVQDSVSLLGTVGRLVQRVFANPAKATAEDWRDVTIGLTKLAGDDNLIGSAGEFGLLLAFLEDGEVARKNSGNAFGVADITSMFVNHQFPNGWKTWRKSALSWVKYSAQLTFYARHHLNTLPKRAF